ncbi:MAG: hypothetical protein EOO88_51850 [Pedobacter sp.]|nr:MAG: hypothetical protein EOO88_51850 [Pedobacter sp.]
MLTTKITSIPAKTIVTISFRIRITQAGVLTNRAQVQSSDVVDPDSTPGNGFTKGEDDEAQSDIRGI